MNQNEGGGAFLTTQWSMVLAARERAAPNAADALARLCETYWYPLFAFVRRQGFDFAEAQDMTQGFFEALLEKDFLKDVVREKGRFRSFLLAAVKHFIANERRAGRTIKRGGGKALFSIDYDEAEQRYQHEPSHEITADQLFEHRWALTLMDNVKTTLREEYAQNGKSDLYAHLKPYLSGDHDAPYRTTAEALQVSETAVKTAAHRLRQRFGDILRREIAETVADPTAIDDEVQALFRAVRLE